MTETANDLHKLLEECHVYCFQQKLNVNVDKKKDTSFFFQKSLRVQIFC